MIGKTNVKSNVESFDPSVVSWGGGSEEEVTTMLDLHYSGKINIADYWAVGDSKTITINEVSATNVAGEVQPSQAAELVIIGINHDDKSDGSGKAAVTVQTKTSLSNTGYINSSNSANYSSWSNCGRRTWCNNNFKSALPTWLQNLIKPVTKVSSRYAYDNKSSYRGQFTTTDSVFLLSDYESVGFWYSAINDEGKYGSPMADGTQYEYMRTTANRCNGSNWWLRSSIVNNIGAAYFTVVGTGGSNWAAQAMANYSFAPAFCL
jgi:hypothetical protein